MGLLATAGTMFSGPYHRAAQKHGMTMLVPDAHHKKLVMESIYGPRGVKARYTDGLCRQQAMAAIRSLAHLCARLRDIGMHGVAVVIYRCEQHRGGGLAIATD